MTERQKMQECPVRRHANAAPDSPAIIEASRQTTYGELDALAEAWRAHFTQTAPSPAAFVAIAAEPSVDYLAAMLGLLRCGLAFVPLNPKAPPSTLLQQVQSVSASAVLCDVPVATALHALDPAHPDRFRSLQPLVPMCSPPIASGAATQFPQSHTIVSTSGSLGLPKFARLGIGNLLANAAASNANIPMGPGARWLLSLPLLHVSGLGVVWRSWLSGGAIALPSPGQSLDESLNVLRPTHLSLVATQLRRLMAAPATRESLRAARTILLGGSAIPEDLVQIAHGDGLRIHKSYGLTEMGSQVTTTRPNASLEELKTSGEALVEGTVRINDDGVIEVTGECRFEGYCGEGQTAANPFTADGWFPTGDLGRFDEHGRLMVLGRRDNMFISGGENIHPEEIEQVLVNLPGVEQAMVVAVPDTEFVAVGFAFVQFEEGRPFNADSLKESLRAALPRFKVPKHLYPWPSNLAATGIKPSRKALLALALAQLEKE